MRNANDFEGRIIQLLREAERLSFERGYAEGVDSAKAKILAAIGADAAVFDNASPSDHTPYADAERSEAVQERKRAPRGLPRALTIRALRKFSNGATPQQILDAAETEFERMIAVSSVRAELRRGQEEGRYIEIDGLWHLAEGFEAEDGALRVQSSASGNDDDKGGKSMPPP
ncbi:hypothetical protein [Roseovarius sp. MBR-6]|jgi:hypothetical protein|uniref:hypothetical protein n=1 Tax=Roseovarius sp. MBR-6 TaxID=3156459 RepID=UPI00339B55F1